MGKRKAKKKSNSVNKTNSYLSRYQVKFARRRAGTFFAHHFAIFFLSLLKLLEASWNLKTRETLEDWNLFAFERDRKWFCFEQCETFVEMRAFYLETRGRLCFFRSAKETRAFSGKHIPKADPFSQTLSHYYHTTFIIFHRQNGLPSSPRFNRARQEQV